jgi:glycosyltransferase involved in cell wall biosynthesis
MKKKQNIVIIGQVYSDPSAKAFLKKFVDIVKEFGREVFIISADPPPTYKNVVWLKLKLKPSRGLIKRLFNDLESQWQIFNYLKSQWQIASILIKKVGQFSTTIVLNHTFVFPVILTRLAKKKVLLFVAQKPVENDVEMFLCELNFIVAPLLIIESENVIKSWNIKKKDGKILNGAIYVDTSVFKKKKKINERERIVGYIGQLERRKGVLDFIEAINILNSSGEDIKYTIGGFGSLANTIKSLIRYFDNVEFKGYITKEELPVVFNQLKLIVLPSYTEGLPSVILEAMACGTPVLASPVGGIPDIIKDSENGFIIENHSPECIAKSIKQVLNYSDLERISENARRLINEKFTYEDAVRRYDKILHQS